MMIHQNHAAAAAASAAVSAIVTYTKRTTFVSVVLVLAAVVLMQFVGYLVFTPGNKENVRSSNTNTNDSEDYLVFTSGDKENAWSSDTHTNDSEEIRLFKATLFANAERKIAERRAWLSDQHNEGPYFANLKSDQMWYIFAPVLPCFWTLEKEPSSNVLHDGGKWLCGLQQVHELRSKRSYSVASSSITTNNPAASTETRLHHYTSPTPCIVYSMGSNNEFSFERRVRMVAPGCEIHTFDPTVKESGDGKDAYDSYHGDYGFAGVDNANDGPFPVKSLSNIMKELKHTHVDYLKVDVEGYEWEFLSTVDWSIIKVGQILVEFHPSHGRGSIASKLTAKEMNAIFTKLEDAGYRLISLEPVTYSNFGQVELVFMHKDWTPSG